MIAIIVTIIITTIVCILLAAFFESNGPIYVSIAITLILTFSSILNYKIPTSEDKLKCLKEISITENVIDITSINTILMSEDVSCVYYVTYLSKDSINNIHTKIARFDKDYKILSIEYVNN